MVKFTSLILLIILVGCSSSDKNNKFSNKDFKKTKSVKYNKKVDSYDFKVSKNEEKLLRNESIDLLSNDALEDIKVKGDELLSISQQCHLNKINEGLKLAKSLSEKYLKNPSYWNIVGICYLKKNELKKASLYFNKALSVRSKYSPAYNNIGIMYNRSGEVNKAIIAFKRALKINPYARSAKLNLAQVLLKVGIPQQAIKYFLQLKKISSDSVVIIGLANSYLQLGKDLEANKAFSGLNKDLFERPDVGLSYALSLFKIGKKDKAHDIFNDIDKDKMSVNLKAYYYQVKKWIGVK
jgi:predicted Zn-dependent protease